MSTPQQSRDDDPFDALLDLEEQYYIEGYNLGVADGSRAGRIEGRVFGLEKGFEKFATMGALAGRCAVWESRLPAAPVPTASHYNQEKTAEQDGKGKVEVRLEQLKASTRLEGHLRTLSALVEEESLPTQNDEDAVSEFDDRLKRAEGKVKVIEKLIGEGAVSSTSPDISNGGGGARSAANSARQVRVQRNTARTDSNMEDFTVPRSIARS
ncbi:hypothetical protein H2203_008363 [Taxawa tesnikishii (nom. ined.)]|nr:hypothetical protein H2203_008363 [Dothideales sp. JES 119]